MDSSIYDLAKYFMKGHLLPDSAGGKTKARDEDINEFAEYLQRCVEEYFEEMDR